MSREITLRIVLQKPLDGTVYGLQKGKGTHYETVQAQPGRGKDLVFDFVVQVKQAAGSVLSLAGPFVQGSSGNRFVYIGIGSYAGQVAAPCSGRLKIPLSEADFLNALSNGSTYGWSCTVLASRADGTPVFATVKPFSGWFPLAGESGDKSTE